MMDVVWQKPNIRHIFDGLVATILEMENIVNQVHGLRRNLLCNLILLLLINVVPLFRLLFLPILLHQNP
jgi:hypothetical protein